MIDDKYIESIEAIEFRSLTFVVSVVVLLHERLGHWEIDGAAEICEVPKDLTEKIRLIWEREWANVDFSL